MEIDNNEVPRYIYKYMSLDGFIEMTTQGALYFATPITYNDPFDTKINISCAASLEEKVSFGHKEGFSDERIKVLSELPESELNEECALNYHKQLSEFRICCFSQLFDNILMWSHYADMHKGVCVGFDTTKDELFNDSTIISYEDQVPIYNIITDTFEDIRRAIYTKSIDWEYEKEIRIIKHTNLGFGNKVPFKKRALKMIILGCRFPDHKKLAIQAIIKKYGYHVTLSQMAPLNEKYKLIKKPLVLPK